jgi:hypothetical protein
MDYIEELFWSAQPMNIALNVLVVAKLTKKNIGTKMA